MGNAREGGALSPRQLLCTILESTCTLSPYSVSPYHEWCHIVSTILTLSFLFCGHVWEFVWCLSTRRARSAVPGSHSDDFVNFFLVFPYFSVQKGQFCSRLQRGRTCIVAQFWVECIRLTRLISSGESTRHVLIDELAASKSPCVSSCLTIHHLTVQCYITR